MCSLTQRVTPAFVLYSTEFCAANRYLKALRSEIMLLGLCHELRGGATWLAAVLPDTQNYDGKIVNDIEERIHVSRR